MRGKRLLKIGTGLFIAAALAAGIISISTASEGLKITKSGGWYETAYAEWSDVDQAVEVYYKKTTDTAYIPVDEELIRDGRVDIPGLDAAFEYDLKIVCGQETAVVTVQPTAYDRSGYAHWNEDSGVGAYNNDGTLKSGVTVLYVTDETKDTVTYNGNTGLYDILNDPATADLDVRLIGAVNPPSGVIPNDGSSNEGTNMVWLNHLKNVTIEGIGTDAQLVRWGIAVCSCESVEIRNLYFYEYPDDAVGIQGSASELSQRIWVHNNEFGPGKNEYAGNGIVDDDKAEGDGATDIGWAQYITVSYNYYKNCHKTSIIGGDETQLQDWITYHHNRFENCKSRTPRARNAHIHVYNNYFCCVSDYCVGASDNAKIFTESNYFFECGNALFMDAIGADMYSGTIKSYGDILDSCSGVSVYTAISEKTDNANIPNLIDGGEDYDNFDLDSSVFYLNNYMIQSPTEARQTCIDHAGRMAD
ncbi:MAG TPA: hypothetical protein PK629_07645 [Oscillospiraceae bacterium]|nr:hypothetical protein [Oscillospiraceae bacterium]HPR75226.1 hypothetical protein [Oscillospiraceae bacterium]